MISIAPMCAGDMSGEVRLPYSMSRGFRFASTPAKASPATVQLPLPGFGRAHATSAVELDGIVVPQVTALHHAEAKGMIDPPKSNTWEGDNMMILPRYKCASAALASQQNLLIWLVTFFSLAWLLTEQNLCQNVRNVSCD
jgi:hypothetical protein